MESLGALIDDYLRVIVRTRPWTKRRTEEALAVFAEWVYSRAGGAETDLAADGDTLAEECADDLRLNGEPREGLVSAVRGLARWASAEGTFPHRPAPTGGFSETHEERIHGN